MDNEEIEIPDFPPSWALISSPPTQLTLNQLDSDYTSQKREQLSAIKRSPSKWIRFPLDRLL